MIICPSCKEEIEDDSCYCDQCGKALAYCERCGRVGIGRRCTSCGGMMLLADELKQSQDSSHPSMSVSMRQMSMRGNMSMRGGMSVRATTTSQRGGIPGTPTLGGGGLPQLQLFNDSLGIRIVGINGAIIGRKQGPYVHFFRSQSYVSGTHAQLLFRPESGWCIADRGSSNGTKLNDHRLQPDVEMSIKNGDIVTIANVVLKVVISVN